MQNIHAQTLLHISKDFLQRDSQRRSLKLTIIQLWMSPKICVRGGGSQRWSQILRIHDLSRNIVDFYAYNHNLLRHFEKCGCLHDD